MPLFHVLCLEELQLYGVSRQINVDQVMTLHYIGWGCLPRGWHERTKSPRHKPEPWSFLSPTPSSSRESSVVAYRTLLDSTLLQHGMSRILEIQHKSARPNTSSPDPSSRQGLLATLRPQHVDPPRPARALTQIPPVAARQAEESRTATDLPGHNILADEGTYHCDAP